MYILGISAFYHDSAAAILKDGEILAAVQEERFTRIKQDYNFPSKAVEYCLREAGIEVKDIDAVVFYDKPLLKFERLLETYLAYAPRGIGSFMKAMPLWLKQKLFIPKEIDKKLVGYDGPIYFTYHHESHAASAFYPSPFEEAAIITFDGVGEWATTTYGVGKGNTISLQEQIEFPHSLGLFYSAFTYYLGFKVNSGEYKVMGLAPYGEPKYVNLILNNLIDIKEDGSFWLNQKYFNYCAGLTMTSKKFEELFEMPVRKPESELSQKHMDIAKSLQVVTEMVMIQIAKYVKKKTGQSNLCLAGGSALNCVANGKILQEGIFDNVWIQPAAGDAGGALGAALFLWYQLEGKKRKIKKPDAQSGSYLGPEYTNDEIEKYLCEVGAIYEKVNEEQIAQEIAQYLSEGNVVGHMNGRLEFGPRALGNRSILGDPRNAEMQKTMNLKIKFRESFRPFAPSCLEEEASEWFEIKDGQDSPYMLLTTQVKSSHCKENTDDKQGLEKLMVERSDVPAITHVDYSARLQTVKEAVNERFYHIIKEFYKVTGCPCVVNTSFNIRGEPIVCSPQDAYRCFMYTDMDVLVIGNFIMKKEEQPQMDGAEEYKKAFKLD